MDSIAGREADNFPVDCAGDVFFCGGFQVALRVGVGRPLWRKSMARRPTSAFR